MSLHAADFHDVSLARMCPMCGGSMYPWDLGCRRTCVRCGREEDYRGSLCTRDPESINQLQLGPKQRLARERKERKTPHISTAATSPEGPWRAS